MTDGNDGSVSTDEGSEPTYDSGAGDYTNDSRSVGEGMSEGSTVESAPVDSAPESS